MLDGLDIVMMQDNNAGCHSHLCFKHLGCHTLHQTLNLCFGAFRTIWAHLGPFGCLTEFSAKRAELVQKFVPRSRVTIFRNERTRPTTLDPKLTFWCVLYYLGAFGAI